MHTSTATTKGQSSHHEHQSDSLRNVRHALSAALPTTVSETRCESSVGTPLEILLVEDNARAAELLQKLLERNQYAVATAACAADARVACQTMAYDLLICDIGLPDQNGWTLMSDLVHRYGVRGIALTAFDSADDIARSKDAGFAAHLSKPFELETLLGAIHDVGQT